MNKKFFSALLLGSLVMGGTFVSCSDYDDDIENLQGQIDKLAGKAELDSQVSSLSSQISAAQGAADAAKTAAAAAQAAADAAKGVADSKLDEAAVKAIAEAAAEGAAAAAQEGKDAAAVAQAAADAAQAAADAAQATADKGVSAAEAAQAAADAAAAAAQKTADKLAEYVTLSELKAAQEVAAAAAEAAKKAGLDAAKVAADAAAAAQKTADEAVAAAKKAAEDAAAAQKAGAAAAEAAAKAAEEAQKTADEAVAAAKKAQETADKVTAAQEAAGAAHAAADAAQKTADEAVAAAKKAAEEAAAAKKDGSAAAEALAQAAAAAQKTADEAVAAAKKAAEDAAAAQGAAAAAQATADAAQAAAEKVATDLAALEVRVKALEVAVKAAATQEALKTVSDKVAEIEKQLKDMAVLKTMVTEVSLIEAYNIDWYNYYAHQGGNIAYNGDALDLGFMSVSEQTTVFGKGLPGEITFEAGKSNSLTTSNIVVRVNPANATIAKEDVQLIDSKGNVLDVIEVAGVKPYEGLITRSTANTGLWTISVKLKDNVTVKELDDATTTKINNVSKKICYAVAIGDETRSVVSTYDITAAPNAFTPSSEINLFASDKEGAWKDIKEIRNRYYYTETWETTEQDEYRWYEKIIDKSEVPAIAENIVTADDAANNPKLYQNVTNRDEDGQVEDNRQGEQLLAVEVNKAINLHVQWNDENKEVENQIKGFYVALDERNALESAPSEINAWKSYEIENLNVVQPGNTGSITIKSGSANGDVIGFRIYAVNLDGTLLDPDGRAFYAYVGNATNVGTVPTQTIKATKQYNSKSTANFLEDFKTAIAGVKDINLSATGWNNVSYPVIKDENGNVISWASTFDVWVTENGTDKLVDASNITTINPAKVTKVWYQMPDAQQFVDGRTYTQKMEIKKYVSGSPVVVKTITVSFTKVMPSEAPVVSYITGQTGELLLSPVANPRTLAEYGVSGGNIANQASINLNNVFYELSRAAAGTISFSVDNSAWKGAPTNAYVNNVTGQNGATTPLVITNSDNNAFKAITDGSTHTIKFKGYYPNISLCYDAENDVMKYDNFSTKESTDFAVTYNCWHKFTTWSWNKIKYEDYDPATGIYTVNPDPKLNTKTFAPELQWTSAGTPIEWGGEILKGKNDKNPEIFNATMADYIANGVVKVAAAADVYLEDVVNPSQKNNYFTPEFVAATQTKAAVIKFTKTQYSSNPETDVKQVLKMKVKDVFGHEVTLTLGDVTILRQSN